MTELDVESCARVRENESNFSRFGLEEVVGVLRSSGLFVRSEDILAIDRVSSDTYRIIIARNGVAGEVYITRRDGRWFRTPLKLHETVKFVDLGVKLVR